MRPLPAIPIAQLGDAKAATPGGKLEILALRDRARTAWGGGFSLQRFHSALLALGAPPLGLMAAALDAPDGR